MADLTTRPLDPETWPAFARLVEAYNGVWGGCWCMAFHAEADRARTAEQNRAAKEARVRDGEAHAALVDDGEQSAGWCQFVQAIIEAVPVLPYGIDTALVHAELLADTRRTGRPRGAHDLIIAATAKSAGRVVVSADPSGFEDLPGVDLHRHR